ncbi:MAG: eukaryotic-like serine/threonine-protein kinase [Verrucomicrobiota bacterium]
MNPRNFFSELKRRNVYKVAVAYAIVSWLLIQAASIFFPAFDAPPWVMKIFIIVIIFGFPVALILAWAFELTLEGIKRADEVDPNESITPRTGRKLIGITIVVAVIAAGLFAFQFLRGKPAATPGPGATVATTAHSGITPEPNDSQPTASLKSIAVLPFENLSSDKENAYFADGIQDEVLTRLSKIAALKVISRTSTQKYKSAPDNLREVGKQLGVANLLEGSVQKIGNAVHVNVQLIRVSNDEHLWAESYNRKLDDVFAVEGEVATAIAEQLNAKLTGSEKESLAIKPTSNPLAYDAYLRGLAFQGRIDGFQTNITKSIEAFEEATRLDPQFALAWAQLVRQDGLAYWNFEQTPQRREAARRAVENAVRLAPHLAETQLAEGVYQSYFEQNYEAAKTRFEAVRQRFPNNAFAAECLGALARKHGQWEQSHQYYKQAIELDPQNVFLLGDASLTDVGRRDVVSARKLLERARNLSPQNSTVTAILATTYQMTGDFEQAQTLLDGVTPADADDWYFQIVPSNAIFLRKYEPAIAMLKAQLTKPEALRASLGSFQDNLADLERHAGDADAATQTYQQARATLEAGLREQPNSANLIGSMAWTETWLGNKTRALELARNAIAVDPTSKNTYTGPSREELLARIEAHFGDKDDAITALQHLVNIPYGPPVVTPALLRLDPDWDNLRGDPRFEKLCQEKQP